MSEPAGEPDGWWRKRLGELRKEWKRNFAIAAVIIAIPVAIYGWILGQVGSTLLKAGESLVCSTTGWKCSEPIRKTEFEARPDVVCEAGDVGDIITKAGKDALIYDESREEDRLARRAFLCATERFSVQPPLEILKLLSKRYPKCFRFHDTASGDPVRPRFRLYLEDDSQVCLGLVHKDHEKAWDTTEAEAEGLAFCMPDRVPSQGRASNLHPELRLCTADSLEAIGVDPKLVSCGAGDCETRIGE